MNQAITQRVLERENHAFRGKGGVSEENRSSGFVPGFQDTETGIVQRSRFADGSPAPFHLLDGLPDDFVVARDASGRIKGVKASVRSGFLRDGRFYTRGEAAAIVSESCAKPDCSTWRNREERDGSGLATAAVS